MPSLIELVEQVNRGDDLAADTLQSYQQSPNSAERFLAHHAGATIGLRASHAHLLESLTAIGFSDRKVLEQYVGLCAFLGREGEATGPTVEFGKSAVGRGEIALGLEAAAAAVAQDTGRGGAWSRVQSNLIDLSNTYEQAAGSTRWGTPGQWTNGQPRIGYLVSALGDDEPAARAAAAFAGHVNSKEFRLNVYATEAFVRRDGQQWAGWSGPSSSRMMGQGRPGTNGGQAACSWINNGYGASPSAARGQVTIGRIKEAGAGSWVAPTNGDIMSAAVALAERITADQTDLLVIDCDITDPIAALLASWKVAAKVMWVARRRPLYSTAVDSVCYLDASAAERDRAWWQQHGIQPGSITEGIDLAAPTGDPARRGQYGIPESAVICCTAVEDVAEQITPAMVDSMIDLLRRQPQAVYLIVGAGDASAVRRRFDAGGVGKRVGYAGRRRDLTAFLKMADVYLCPFAGQSGHPASPAQTLTAMGAGLPVLALGSSEDASASEPIGAEAMAGDVESWLDRAASLIRDGASRRRIGQQMRRRVEEHYSYTQTADAMERMMIALLAGKREGTTTKAATTKATIIDVESDEALAREAA